MLWKQRIYSKNYLVISINLVHSKVKKAMMSAYILTDMFNQVVIWTRINPIFELQTTKNINPIVLVQTNTDVKPKI
jgi:hypothetical protein